MVDWRYGISLLVFNSKSHEWAQRTGYKNVKKSFYTERKKPSTKLRYAL